MSKYNIYLQTFNNDIDKLLSELQILFPKDKKFKKYQVTFNQIIQANKKSVWMYFLKYVLPFTEQIKNNDDKFFMNFTIDAENNVVQEILCLKDQWQLIPKQKQQQIWKIINDLLVNGCTIANIISNTTPISLVSV